jgi:hypothetical protein
MSIMAQLMGRYDDEAGAEDAPVPVSALLAHLLYLRRGPGSKVRVTIMMTGIGLGSEGFHAGDYSQRRVLRTSNRLLLDCDCCSRRPCLCFGLLHAQTSWSPVYEEGQPVVLIAAVGWVPRARYHSNAAVATQALTILCMFRLRHCGASPATTAD